jgi:hypothetical protein
MHEQVVWVWVWVCGCVHEEVGTSCVMHLAADKRCRGAEVHLCTEVRGTSCGMHRAADNGVKECQLTVCYN